MQEQYSNYRAPVSNQETSSGFVSRGNQKNPQPVNGKETDDGCRRISMFRLSLVGS
jgi:hypothetical protein